jgi:hypothetical protein
MDERGANIDLVFRNGLRDYEVLPPPEVWDNIHPVIKVNKHRFIFLRTAAVVAVLVTLSFLAYMINRDKPLNIENSFTALNINIYSPISVKAEDPSQTLIPIEKSAIDFPGRSFSSDVAVANFADDNSRGLTNENTEVQEYANIDARQPSVKNGRSLASLKAAYSNSSVISSPEPQYIPEVSKITNGEKWSIGALASPTYYSRFNTESNDLSKQLAASEKSVMSYSVGAAVSYKINKRFSVQTGLYFSSMGQDLGQINSFSGFQKYDNTKGANNFEVLTSSGQVITNNPDVFLNESGPVERIQTVFTNDVFDPEKASLQYMDNNLIQNFSYIELPVVLRYKFIDKALDFNLIGGIAYNLLVNNDVYAVVNGEKYSVGETMGLNTLALSSSVGMGMEYSFSKKLSLNIEPTFRYYLNPFREIPIADSHPFSFGIFSGVSYKF